VGAGVEGGEGFADDSFGGGGTDFPSTDIDSSRGFLGSSDCFGSSEVSCFSCFWLSLTSLGSDFVSEGSLSSNKET
jgi:hypothetical protein